MMIQRLQKKMITTIRKSSIKSGRHEVCRALPGGLGPWPLGELGFGFEPMPRGFAALDKVLPGGAPGGGLA